MASLLAVLGASRGWGAESANAVHVSLLSEQASARPGQSLTVGVRIQMDPGWHTYWKNPGDSGLPTRIRWDLPAGLTTGPLQWPVPTPFGEGPVVNYGYAGDVLLLTEVAVPPGAGVGSTLRIGASVQWLECREICRPGRGTMEIEIPVRRERPASSAAVSLFVRARKQLPARPTGWTLRATAEPRALHLEFRAPRAVPLERARFYPDERWVLDHAAPQALTLRNGTHVLALACDLNRVQPIERLSGVLVTEGRGRTQAVEIDLPLERRGG